MNSVNLIGRLTKDPEIRYTTGQNPTARAVFTLAIDRPTRQGAEKRADFPRVIAFGRMAEVIEKYLHKGQRAAVSGTIQTGSYQNKKGDTVYTTDVVASRVDIIDWPDQQREPQRPTQQTDLGPDFEQLNEEVPF